MINMTCMNWYFIDKTVFFLYEGLLWNFLAIFLWIPCECSYRFTWNNLSPPNSGWDISVETVFAQIAADQVTRGCFTDVSWALQNIFSKFMHCRNRTSYDIFKLKLCNCMCAQSFGLTYQVSAWNSHHICDFWHSILSRDYFGELVKH